MGSKLSIKRSEIEMHTAVSDGVRFIGRYREAALRQHGRFIATWRGKDYERALVELHFFLICVCRVLGNMELIGDVLGGEVQTYVAGKNYGDYRDARNHFEHIDDRLHGSRKNVPEPVIDGANPRTIHFGLDGSRTAFLFGAKSIDVSDSFLAEFSDFVDGLDPLLKSLQKNESD